VGLRGWWVVVVTYLAGTPLHRPPVTSLSFIVIPSSGVCQWGCGRSLTSVVVPCPCCLSVGLPVVHCHLLLLSPVPVMSCCSLSAIVGLHHVRGSGTGIVGIVDAWEWVVERRREEGGGGGSSFSRCHCQWWWCGLVCMSYLLNKSILKPSLRNLSNPLHGCGFQMGISNMTHTHTRLTRTQYPHRFANV
jgi:hypothetical protein